MRKQLGVVLQDTFLFSGNVADNLRLDSSIDNQRLKDVCSDLGLDNLLKKLPNGLDTYIEKNRDFLDALGDFCEKVNRFPDISFGKTYANITIRPAENNVKEEISKGDHDFASEIDFLNKHQIRYY